METSPNVSVRTKISTVTASRELMAPDIPAAKKLVERYGAADLSEMIFGEDA